MKCDFASYFTRQRAAEYLGVTVNVITMACNFGRLEPAFRQDGRVFYTKDALDEYRVKYRVASAPPGMLSFRDAAEYLQTTKNYMHRLVYLGKIVPDLKDGARKFFYKETLDDFLAGQESPQPDRDVPDDYISTADLLKECLRLNKRCHRKPRTCSALWGYLKKRGVPHRRIRNSSGPGYRFVWLEREAREALEYYTPKARPEENHLIAPPEVLRSAKWVTCARAAEIIGCTAAEISSRAVKYSFKSYLHPETKRLLVNWLEVKESMCWRKPSFIRKHLGAAGYNLVKRTCQKKRFTEPMGGVVYRVPELLGAERKKKGESDD